MRHVRPHLESYLEYGAGRGEVVARRENASRPGTAHCWRGARTVPDAYGPRRVGCEMVRRSGGQRHAELAHLIEQGLTQAIGQGARIIAKLAAGFGILAGIGDARAHAQVFR